MLPISRGCRRGGTHPQPVPTQEPPSHHERTGNRPVSPNRRLTKIYQTTDLHVAIIDSLIVFVVGLLVGALGIYVGAKVIVDVEDYTYAIVTALIASLLWAIVGRLLGWIPLLGPLLALLVYIGVLNWRYPGGWLKATGIALIAWVASMVVLYVLALIGVTSFGAVGVPGA